MGHRHWFGRPFPAPTLPVPVGSLPSGQLISCAQDMAHTLVAHLNGGKYGNAQVLSPAGMDELHHGVKEYVKFGISAGAYGMGWFETGASQAKTFSHGGNVPDFSAFMAILPGQKKGLVLLFNADPYGLPPIMEEVGMGATALLAGQQPAPIKLDFIQWVMRLLPLIPLLQVLGVFATLRMLRRWRRDPASRPSQGRIWGRHILLPLVPNLALASILAGLRSSGMIAFLQLFIPDLAWIARISGGFASRWAPLRTGLILSTLRASSSSRPSDEHAGTRV
jgi:CubicO group peptidase (beta-lactamase class C family)